MSKCGGEIVTRFGMSKMCDWLVKNTGEWTPYLASFQDYRDVKCDVTRISQFKV